MRAKQLLDPDFESNLADPNQSEEDAAAQAAQQGVDDLDQNFEDLANSDVSETPKQKKVLDLLETSVIQ